MKPDNIRRRSRFLPFPLFLLTLYPQYVYALPDLDVRANDVIAAAAATTTAAKSGHNAGFIAQACLIPVLVILSGILAGLTLGYMSLDETQLRVLSVSGTEKQKAYAQKIEPIRKNGHLLLTTLLLGNMIVNETLPVLSENVLGGGIQAVVVSTVLIVIFSEIIPQSLCSRFGLQIGAFMATPTKCLVYSMYVVAWPISKLLEYALGPHHGIVYRRNELKELINMHSAMEHHGGDLQMDTVTMVGGALDFQEKTVRDAMTPIDKVFMLPIETRLDYETLAKVVRSGHSRVPVYEEIKESNGQITKKIIGILLVKQCVLLDPEDATPLREIPLNTVPTVPYDEPLLLTLDRFQQGNSHMAVVSRIPAITESKAKPGSVNDEAKVGLTRRFLNRVRFGEDSSSSSSSESSSDEDGTVTGSQKGRKKSKKRKGSADSNGNGEAKNADGNKNPKGQNGNNWMQWNRLNALEQTMPSDAILPDKNADEFLAGLQRAPLGIITLEDVIEELIGEEILDEFDLKGPSALPASSYVPEEAQRAVDAAKQARAAAKKIVAPGPAAPEKTGDPLGASNSGTATPTNLRIVQNIRAVRGMKAGGAASVASVPVTKRDRSAPPGNRSIIPSQLNPAISLTSPGGSDTQPTEGNVELPSSIEVSPLGQSDEPSTSSTPTRIPTPLSLPVPLPAAVTALQASASVAAANSTDDVTVSPASAAQGVPMARGGSKGAKKRVFKSPIGGESATPGLEKRSDPMAAARALAALRAGNEARFAQSTINQAPTPTPSPAPPQPSDDGPSTS